MKTLALETPTPAHVPAELVIDFDIYDVRFGHAEYQQALTQLTDDGAPDVLWTPRNGGHWIATRYEGMTQILGDEDHFSARHISIPKKPPGSAIGRPLQMDRPEHLDFKALLAPFLAPKPVAVLGDRARQLAISLIEGFQARGECEFVTEFAQHLPITIFMQIVGLPPEDRVMITGWAEGTMRGETEEIRDAARARLAGYSMEQLKARRANPGDDLISALVKARVHGEALDDQTLVGMVIFLLIAGLDTVASSLGFFARFLAMNPGHRHQLIDDPSLIPNAVEELLRRFPVVLASREVKADHSFFGAPLLKGDMILAPTPLAGLDDRKFENPFIVDFKRPKPLHMTFGGATHRCMGSMLARTELRIFLEEWLKRIPDFEIAPGQQAVVKARAVATVASLPLKWTPR